MSLALPSFKRLALLLFLVVPIAAWIFVKPIRVLYPKASGVVCRSAVVCVEDPAQAAVATALYDEAYEFVSSTVGPMKHKPRLVFCSTVACADRFALGDRAALTVGTFGIVIGPRAWEDYLVRHEMIHHVQCEQLGVLKVLRLPAWFVEGMAYSMSEDPHAPLAQPLQDYRSTFAAWYARIDKPLLWFLAKKL